MKHLALLRGASVAWMGLIFCGCGGAESSTGSGGSAGNAAGGSTGTTGSAGMGGGSTGGSTATGGGSTGGSTATGGGPTGGSGGMGGGPTGGSTATGGGGSAPWWDESIAQDPPETGFLFIGRPAEDVGGSECIYRYSPDSPPEVLFCPELDPDSMQATFGATEVPTPGLPTFIAEVEQFVSDLYPSEVYRISVADGQATLLDKLYFPLFEEGFLVEGVKSLDASRYAALLWRFPVDGSLDTREVFTATAAVDLDAGVVIPGSLVSLRGILSNGALAVASANGVGIFLVDVSSSPPSIAEDLPIAHGTDVAPDGSAIVYELQPFNPPSTVGAFGPGGNKTHSVPGKFSAAGWVGSDRVLVGGEGGYFLWTPSNDGWTSLASSVDYEPRSSFRAVAGGAAGFVAYRVSGGETTYGVGWYGSGQLAPRCGSLERLRTIQDLPGESAPVVLLDAGGDGLDAPRLGAVYSCRPGGEPVELLAAHGLVGRLLAPADFPFD